MQKLQKANMTMQNQFIEMIKQPKRDMFVENVKIDDMIMGSIKFGGTFIK